MNRADQVRPSPRYQLGILFLCAVLLFLLLVSLAEFWHMVPDLPRLWGYSLVAVAFGWLWWRFPGAGFSVTLLAPLAFLAGGSISIRWYLLLQTLWSDLLEYWSNLQVAGLEAQFSVLLGEAFLLLIGCALAPLFLRESLGRGTAFHAAALGTAIFGMEWSWFFDESLPYFIPYLLLAFLLWAVGQAAHRRAQWKAAQRRILNRPGIGAAVGAIAGVALVASFLPTDLPAMDLGALGERAQDLFPVLMKLRGAAVIPNNRFTLSTTGFSPNPNTLGGPVALDDRLAVVMMVPELPRETIYLRGTTFRIYSGRNWFPGETDFEAVPPDSILPTHFAEDVPVEPRTFMIREVLDFGRTLFGVLEPARVEDIDYLADRNGNLLAAPEAHTGHPYTVTARVPIYSADQIRALATSSPGREFQPYLQLPISVPARVRELARNITSGATHPYDKAVALENWLRQMPYDLNVPAPPTGRDFVDYFLFDLKRGYCTYFSTAMVVMLRELGIPARLVEGFAVSPTLSNPQPTGEGVILFVTNAMAHAWVEAYFPSYGWVTFDPTPRGDLPVPDRSAPAPSPEEADPGEAAVPTEPETTETPEPAPPETPAEGDTTLPGDSDAPGAAGRSIPPAAWLLALVLISLLVATDLRLRRPYQSAQEDPALAVQQVWIRTERLMARFGAGRRPHQTYREYARSLVRRWPSLQQAAAQMARDYEQARYAPPGDEPEPAAAQRARVFWLRIQRLLRTQYGWFGYLWRRLGLPGLRPRKQA